MELFRKVLILRREEKDLSGVALVTGNVKYAWTSLSTSQSIPLTTLL